LPPLASATLLRFTAVAVPVIGIAAKISTAGWLLFLLWPFYLVFAGCHILVHIRIAKPIAAAGGWELLKVIASHVALLLAFLFQWDVGDGPDWITLTDMIYGLGNQPSWMPHMPHDLDALGMVFDLALFVPAFLSWWLFRGSRIAAGASTLAVCVAAAIALRRWFS
jgi:hypothetical protein